MAIIAGLGSTPPRKKAERVSWGGTSVEGLLAHCNRTVQYCIVHLLSQQQQTQVLSLVYIRVVPCVLVF